MDTVLSVQIQTYKGQTERKDPFPLESAGYVFTDTAQGVGDWLCCKDMLLSHVQRSRLWCGTACLLPALQRWLYFMCLNNQT